MLTSPAIFANGPRASNCDLVSERDVYTRAGQLPSRTMEQPRRTMIFRRLLNCTAVSSATNAQKNA